MIEKRDDDIVEGLRRKGGTDDKDDYRGMGR